MPVRDPRIDRGRPDTPVTQVVLDELQGHPRVEQVGRDGMAKAVAGVACRETGPVPVPDEEVLNLALAEWTYAPRKEGPLRRTVVILEIFVQELEGRREEGPLIPDPTFESAHGDSLTSEVKVAAAEKRDLPHPEPVEVNEGEEHHSPRGFDHTEEALDLVLGEVAGRLLGEWHEGEAWRTAPFSRTARFGLFK